MNNQYMRSAHRLAIYRKRASEAKTEYYKNWRQCRYGLMAGYRKNFQQFTMRDNGRIYADSLEVIGQYIGAAGDYMRLKYTGYYADNSGFSTITGGVVKLRHSRGVDYIPVTFSNEYDGVTLYFNDRERVEKGAQDHENAIRAAASGADHHAEREAERERENDAKNAAENEIYDLQNEISEAKKAARELIHAIRAQREAGAIQAPICEALISKLKQYKNDVKAARARIAALNDNFWLSIGAY